MCYPKPGPRCSSHALDKLHKAAQAFRESRTDENYGAYRDALADYYITPAGLRKLAADVESEQDPDKRQKLQDLKDQSHLRRAQLLKAVGVPVSSEVDGHILTLLNGKLQQVVSGGTSVTVPNDTSELSTGQMKVGNTGLSYPAKQDKFALEDKEGKQVEFVTAQGDGFEHIQGFRRSDDNIAYEMFRKMNEKAKFRDTLRNSEVETVISEGYPIFSHHMREHSNQPELSEFNEFDLRDWTPDNQKHMDVVSEAIINVYDQRNSAYENANIVVPLYEEAMKEAGVEDDTEIITVNSPYRDGDEEGKMTAYDQGWLYGFLHVAKVAKETSYMNPDHQPSYDDIAEEQQEYWTKKLQVEGTELTAFQEGMLDGLDNLLDPY